MRASVIALMLVAIGLASTSTSTAATGTTLRVTYWADSSKATESVTWTLRCEPAGGTLARPARACARLESGGLRLFAPLSKNLVCTEIYGGPQRARVVGTMNGKRVWATFTRTNGCEIARWQRIAPWLVPPGGVT